MVGRLLLVNNAHRALLQAQETAGALPAAASSYYSAVRGANGPPGPVIFGVLGSLFGVLFLLILSEYLRRRGCKLWRLSTWRRSGRTGAPGAGAAGDKQAPCSTLAQVKVVPLLVIMPDQQMQCALKADRSVDIGAASAVDIGATSACGRVDAGSSAAGSTQWSSSGAGSTAGSSTEGSHTDGSMHGNPVAGRGEGPHMPAAT